MIDVFDMKNICWNFYI